MWRYLTRSLHQNFKRRACVEKQDKNLNKEQKFNTTTNKCCIAELIPCTNKSLNRFASKFGCNDDSKQEFNDKSNLKHHTLFEAFGWSSALVFGWVISKQLWLKQRLFLDKDERGGSIFEHPRLIQFLAQIARTQPPAAFVLPKLPSTHADESKKSGFSQSASDELECAAEELMKVHEQAIGEALNRRGIASISKSTGAEAMSYFRRASKFNYPPASFNMGQCYELGIGAEQDFKQAAEWYKIASDQGHATAMYNLGVFYAHGWGGLEADISMAKQLFVKAAKLGQADAKSALNRETKYKTDQLQKPSSVDVEYIENGLEHVKYSETKTHERTCFTNSFSDESLHTSFSSDNKWNMPINSAVAF